MEQSRIAYRVLVEKPEGKRLGRPRRRWEDNIRMDLREVGCDPGEWIDLDQDRVQWRTLVREVMNFQVPQQPIRKFIISRLEIFIQVLQTQVKHDMYLA